MPESTLLTRLPDIQVKGLGFFKGDAKVDNIIHLLLYNLIINNINNIKY